MTVPAIPPTRAIPSVGFAIQDLLRDPPPVMILDMGQGSREQSLPVRRQPADGGTARTTD